VQAFAYARGIPLDCGCFGTIARTAVGLGIPTFLMLALPARWLSLDKRLFGSVDRFTIRLGRRSN
jgi:hypothetical protein